MKPRNLNSLWMLAAGLFFACMGALVKLGAQKFSSAELVFYRSLFGLVFIFMFARSTERSLATPHWKLQLVRSVLGFAALMLFFYAISVLPLATAVTLNYTSPIFLAILTLFYLRNESRPILHIAIVMGFIGVALLLQPEFDQAQWLAGVMGLASGLLAGIVYLQVTKLGRMGEPAWRTVFYFTLLSTVGSGLWMLIHEFHALDARDLLLLFAMGSCATLAQLAMTRAYGKGSPLVAGSLAYSTVVLASLFGIALWNETLSPTSWLGIGMIVLSGVISTLRVPFFDKSRQPPTLETHQEN